MAVYFGWSFTLAPGWTEALDLRPVEVRANVLFLEPFDAVVWERTRNEAGLSQVAPSQCVLDLLTGTGREPTEAEALMFWTQRNESAGQARVA